jgi:hypothetical protein
MLPPRLTATIILLALATATGCVHRPSPYMPEDWPRYPAAVESLAGHAETPRLQVIIGYFAWWPNHTALRLVAPDRPVLFWDPGGGYGLEPPRRERIRDVIVEGAPNIPTYLPFRWYNNDALIEIFEWRLANAEALRLHHILLAGAGLTPRIRRSISTRTHPVSSALRRSADFSIVSGGRACGLKPRRFRPPACPATCIGSIPTVCCCSTAANVQDCRSCGRRRLNRRAARWPAKVSVPSRAYRTSADRPGRGALPLARAPARHHLQFRRF